MYKKERVGIDVGRGARGVCGRLQFAVHGARVLRWCVTPVTGMADINCIREACGLHGLAAEWRHRYECYAVFRPLTPRTICFFEAIDVEDPELAAMEWSMMEMFDDTPPRYWRPV